MLKKLLAYVGEYKKVSLLSPVQLVAGTVLIASILYLNLGKVKIDIEGIDKVKEADI